MRMWVRGAKGTFDRETGYISELEERNIRYNPTLVPSLFDATLYGMLRENENITMLLNASCLDATSINGHITSVTAWQLTTYTYFTITAKLFADCSGDSILAPLVGAIYHHGREGQAEFNETIAPIKADTKTMGMSVMLAARETDSPVTFTPPSFAKYYPDDSYFIGDIKDVHAQIRNHIIGTSGTNLWWIELGGDGDSIHDADRIRDELLAVVFGVWDHIKNHGDHGMQNWDLEWVGFLPGKRESRRYVGDYVLTEHDVISGGHFEDEIAFGGWPLDDHNPLGMKREDNYTSYPSLVYTLNEIYGIPLRCLYSKNIDNLLFAGRNISATHAALSSTRVMATCALLGQAAGTAAATSITRGISVREAAQNHYKEIQKTLMDDGVFLPHVRRIPSNLTLSASLNISDKDRDALLNGIERPRKNANENGIRQILGDKLTFTFDGKKRISSLRLRFDPDFERMSVSDNKKMRIFAMKLHTGKDFRPVRVANTIVKSFAVLADGVEVAKIENNFRSLVVVPLNVTASEISIVWLQTNGAKDVHLFSADLI